MTSLDNVASAAKAKRDLEKTLEARLRAEMAVQLEDADAAIVAAVAEAIRDGSKKAAIGRAIGTKDYNTYNAYIKRALNVMPTGSKTASGAVIEQHGAFLYVEYNGWHADFTVAKLDGGIIFSTGESLWNDDYSQKNEVVDLLDVRDDTWLYDEVLDWYTKNA